MASAFIPVEERRRAVFRPPTDVSPPGLPIQIKWAGVSGATDIDLTSATISISPAVVEKSLGDLSMATQGQQREFSIPAGQLIRALTLKNLKLDDGSDARSDSELKDRRLVIAVVDAGGKVSPPLFAVPPTPQRGGLPPSLTGASYRNNVLRLPDVAATRLRLALVQNDFPENFTTVAMSLDSASGTAAVLPRDLKLLEPDGATVVWSFPGPAPAQSPEVRVDLRNSIRKIFSAALKKAQPLEATFHLVGAESSSVLFDFSGAMGSLSRSFPGSVATELTGDPAALALAGDPLPDETPTSVTADLTLKYAGLRIHEDISDAVPVSAGGVSGPTVGQEPVLRSFPPQAFNKFPLVRAGLVGRAPVDCELSVHFADAAGNRVGSPGIVKPKPSTTISTAWVDLPQTTTSTPPVALSVRSNTGRFFWAGGSIPLTRFAVRDSDPGGRPITLNGTMLATVEQQRQTLKAHGLPASVFRGAPPLLASNLFVTVDISSLVLRYSR